MKATFRWLEFGVALSIGVAAFFLVMGPLALNPINLAWLDGGYDPTQHYLGWVFFRQSPWSFPIGLNPQYGLDISSAIVFADSIPLFAFIFKLFANILPVPFQYIGLWNFICFGLQAYFAWLLVSLVTRDWLMRIFATGLFVFSPPMFFRLGLHAALASHFLVLAAIYLNLRLSKPRQGFWWVLLLCTAALVHFYLFVMVFALWVADILDRFFMRQEGSSVDKRYYLQEVALVLIALLITAWQAGYFAVSAMSAATGDYGFYNFNLLAPFQADGWSYLFPSWPHPNNGEGFNYFGLGIIFLLIASLRYWIMKTKHHTPFFREHLYFVLSLCVLTVFAMTNHVVIGPWEWQLPMPDFLYRIASILRGSGRLFWPVWYVLLLLFIYWLSKSYSRTVASIILAVAFCIQVADTSAGWLPKRHGFMMPFSSRLGTSLVDPFWNSAAQKYTKVLRSALPISPVYYYVNWKTWSQYAAENNLGTNAAWLSRYNQKNLAAANEAMLSAIQTGVYDPEALYVLEKDKLMQALAHYNDKTDLIADIDGVYVLAPGWINCQSCLPIKAEQKVDFSTLVPRVGEVVLFSKGIKSKYLLTVTQGWAHPEPWGIWSEGTQAQVIFGIPKDRPKSLTLTMRAFVTPKHPTQEFAFWVNGVHFQDVVIRSDSNNRLTIPITPAIQNSGSLNLDFKFKNPAKPADYGVGDDSRLLAIGLESAVFQ